MKFYQHKDNLMTKEAEMEKQRKQYEDNIKNKKNLIKAEFEKLEEIKKCEDLAVYCKSEIKFKHQLNLVSNFRKSQEQKKYELENKLIDLVERNVDNEPLPAPTKSQYHQQSQQNFSSVFSRSYYRTSSVQYFSTKNINDKIEIHEQVALVNAELENVNRLIQNELETQQTIEQTIQNIIKSTLKSKFGKRELQYLNKLTEIRFNNLEAIEFQAKNKQLESVSNLKDVKQQIQQISQIEEGYLSNKKEQIKSDQKQINDYEEITAEDMIKIDQAEKKNYQLHQQIDELKIQERKILEKRMQSKYILKYIQCFEQFEDIFMRPALDKQMIADLYHKNQSQRNQQKHLMNSKSETLQEDTESKSGMSPKTILQFHQDDLNTIKEQKSEEEQDLKRTYILETINKFYSKRPDGVKMIIESMLNLYNQLVYVQNNQNGNYEELLKKKTNQTSILTSDTSYLEFLKEKNQYIQEMDESPEFAEKMTILNDAIDSGIIRIDQNQMKSFYESNLVDHQHNAQLILTINILKFLNQDFTPESVLLDQEILRNNKLIFRFMYNSFEAASRVFKLCIEIARRYKDKFPPDFIEKNKQVIKIINDFQFQRKLLRGGPVQQTGLKNSQSYTQQNHFKGKDFQFNIFFVHHIKGAQMQKNSGDHSNLQLNSSDIIQKKHSIDGGYGLINPQILHNQNMQNVLSKQFVHEILKENFQTCQKMPILCDLFYSNLKNNMIVFYFLTDSDLVTFIQNIKAKYGDTEIAILNSITLMNQLQDAAIKGYQEKQQNIFQHYVEAFLCLQTLSSDLKQDLIRENVDPARLEKIMWPVSQIHNKFVVGAQNQIVEKLINYKNNHDMLLDDLIIFKSEDNEKISIEGNQKDSQLHNLIDFIMNKKLKETNAQSQMSEKKMQQKNSSVQEQEERKKQEKSKLNLDFEQAQQKDIDDECEQLKFYIQSEHQIQQEKIEKSKNQKEENHNGVTLEIQQVNDRLHGEISEKAHILNSFSKQNLVLSKIDRLDKTSFNPTQNSLVQIKEQKVKLQKQVNDHLNVKSDHYMQSTQLYQQRKMMAENQRQQMLKQQINNPMYQVTQQNRIDYSQTDHQAKQSGHPYSQNNFFIPEYDNDKDQQKEKITNLDCKENNLEKNKPLTSNGSHRVQQNLAKRQIPTSQDSRVGLSTKNQTTKNRNKYSSIGNSTQRAPINQYSSENALLIAKYSSDVIYDSMMPFSARGISSQGSESKYLTTKADYKSSNSQQKKNRKNSQNTRTQTSVSGNHFLSQNTNYNYNQNSLHTNFDNFPFFMSTKGSQQTQNSQQSQQQQLNLQNFNLYPSAILVGSRFQL